MRARSSCHTSRFRETHVVYKLPLICNHPAGSPLRGAPPRRRRRQGRGPRSRPRTQGRGHHWSPGARLGPQLCCHSLGGHEQRSSFQSIAGKDWQWQAKPFPRRHALLRFSSRPVSPERAESRSCVVEHYQFELSSSIFVHLSERERMYCHFQVSK